MIWKVKILFWLMLCLCLVTWENISLLKLFLYAGGSRLINMTQGKFGPSLPVVILPLMINIAWLVGIKMSNINFLIVENLVKLMLELFVLSLSGASTRGWSLLAHFTSMQTLKSEPGQVVGVLGVQFTAHWGLKCWYWVVNRTKPNWRFVTK